MHPNPQTSDYSLTGARELLMVGFYGPFEENITHFPYQDTSYRCALENNSFLAFRWLEKRVDQLRTYHLPYAVLCRHEWLIENEFRLAQQLAAHPDLCSVPLVVFSQKGTQVDITQLAAAGVDDCYFTPVEWNMLERRLEFLNQFKPRVLEASRKVKRELYGYRLPRYKKAFDIGGALFGIVLSSWIWLPVMLAIWLESRGPVVYKSKRVGSGYQVFDFFKFRSMYQGAEEQLNDIRHLNQYQNSEGKEVFVKIVGDPRVTRVGRFIRKYSIDELPQLINVLRGEMSLVGNRPLPLYEAEALTNDEWSARFLAPAGITGLWQISKRGRPDMSVEERIRLDIAYAQAGNSVWNDFVIVLKTFLAFVQKENV